MRGRRDGLCGSQVRIIYRAWGSKFKHPFGTPPPNDREKIRIPRHDVKGLFVKLTLSNAIAGVNIETIGRTVDMIGIMVTNNAGQ